MLNDSVWLHEVSWPHVSRYLETNDLILVPVGATEQHGRHLPLMVDTGWAVAVAEQVARQAGLLVAPPIHYGWSPHHLAFPGTVTLRPETLTDVIVDVCRSLIHHGFKRIVLINGNRVANLAPMEIAASKVRFGTGAFVSVVDVGLIARREVSQICAPGENGHAADGETSFFLHWRPELVDMEQATETSATQSKAAIAHDLLPLDPPFDVNAALVTLTDDDLRRTVHGVEGSSRAATAEKGSRILAAIVNNTLIHINEIKDRAVEVKATGIPI